MSLIQKKKIERVDVRSDGFISIWVNHSIYDGASKIAESLKESLIGIDGEVPEAESDFDMAAICAAVWTPAVRAARALSFPPAEEPENEDA